MIQDYDAIKWTIDRYIRLVRVHANKRIHDYNKGLCNPNSSVWNDPKERQERFPEETWLAQMAELAINQFIHGKRKGMTQYNKSRKKANKNPFKSDGRTDVLGFQADVKCSGLRAVAPYMSTQHLSVPWKDRQGGKPLELIPENIFVLAIVKPGDLNTEGPRETWRMVVYLVGWAWDHEFLYLEERGTFENKWTIQAYKLHKMRNFPDLQRNGTKIMVTPHWMTEDIRI